MKKLIIFDLDNTLFKSKESYKYILADVISETWGIAEDISVKAFDDTEIEMSNFKGYDNIKEFYKEFNIKFLNKLLGSVETKKAEEFDGILKEMKSLVPVKLKTYPLVKETLTELKGQGYSLAILTGTWEKKIRSFNDPEYAKEKREMLEKLLDNSRLSDIIDKLFISYEYATVKPDPKSFQIVLDHFGVIPKDAIMIGDKEADILASKLGISSILFDPKNKYSGKTIPNHIIKDFSELQDVLESYS